ncbi:MAG: hypothetical protein K2N05_07180 [Muribaculaceae bacterium]|nr:hypothetical protein [Muribaculaceae bacterium]
MANKTTSLVSVSRLKSFCLALVTGTLLFASVPVVASESDKIKKFSVSSPVSAEQTPKQVEKEYGNEKRESIFGTGRPLDNSHFTWGADFGASVDLTAHDMSTFDLDVILGYKNSFIKTAGIGVGIHRTVQGGDNFIPLYALFRSSFTSKPSLLFLNVRIGYSFNTVDNSPMFGDYNSAVGCGINLSQTKKAKSYIIVGVGYRYFNKQHQDYISRLDTHYIWMAQLQFGVNF